jgi:hypothetical protein
MLLAGPDARLLCKMWCDPAEAARTGCHHDEARTSPRVTGSDCGDVALNAAAVLVTADARRGVSDPDARHPVVVPRYRFPASTSEALLSPWTRAGT